MLNSLPCYKPIIKCCFGTKNKVNTANILKFNFGSDKEIDIEKTLKTLKQTAHCNRGTEVMQIFNSASMCTITSENRSQVLDLLLCLSATRPYYIDASKSLEDVLISTFEKETTITLHIDAVYLDKEELKKHFKTLLGHYRYDDMLPNDSIAKRVLFKDGIQKKIQFSDNGRIEELHSNSAIEMNFNSSLTLESF